MDCSASKFTVWPAPGWQPSLQLQLLHLYAPSHRDGRNHACHPCERHLQLLFHHLSGSSILAQNVLPLQQPARFPTDYIRQWAKEFHVFPVACRPSTWKHHPSIPTTKYKKRISRTLKDAIFVCMQHKKCVHFLPYRILTNQSLPANIMCCKDEIHIDKSVRLTEG